MRNSILAMACLMGAFLWSQYATTGASLQQEKVRQEFPARLNGQAVACCLSIPVRFWLNYTNVEVVWDSPSHFSCGINLSSF